MSINLIGRGRSVGLGQQELDVRLPKRSDSSSETSVVFQRGTPDVTRMLHEAFSKPSKIQAAQEGLTGNVGTAMTPTTQIVANGSIKNPALSAIPTSKATPQRAPTGRAYTRNLLTDPSKQAYIKSAREKLATKGCSENLDFLLDLKKFRDNPTVEAAKELKRIYIDSNEDVDASNVTADQFGMISQSKEINITAKDRKIFLTDFESCMKYTERGESLNSSGLLHIFAFVEEHTSQLLIKELQQLKMR